MACIKAMGAAALFLVIANMAQGVTSGPSADTIHSYPPSCLASPLTDTPSGPVILRQNGSLNTLDASNGFAGAEIVGFTFWRIPCANGKSALMMQVARRPGATNFAQWFYYGMQITQGTQSGTARVALEPNTLFSGVSNELISSTATFVFENSPNGPLPAGIVPSNFDFNKELTVGIPNAAAIGIDPPPPGITVAIPAYDMTQYADASLALPITGYLAGNWSDPAHSGEGVQTEIGEIAGTTSRYLVFAWYTYDGSGIPYWLFGSGNFQAGARSVSLTVAYEAGGGFAGAFGSSATPAAWGNVTVNFPDCNTMAFSYLANMGLPNGVPRGAGSKQWTRLTAINGLVCQ